MTSETQRTATWPALPLKNSVLFPQLLMPLAIGRPPSIAAVETALASEDKTLLAFAQRDPQTEEPTPQDLYQVGTLAVIRKMERTEGGLGVILQGIERVRITEVEQTTPYLKVRAATMPSPTDTGADVDAMHRAVLDLAAKIHAIIEPRASLDVQQMLSQIGEPLHEAYLIASMLGLDAAKAQTLLEANRRLDALRMLHDYLAYELQVLELRQKITTQAQSEMGREQREYLLRQQMRAIQDELGERDPEHAELSELRERFETADLPDNVRKEAERELQRLQRLPTAAPDYQITRTYLDLVLELPWKKTTEDILDLPRARQILDEDHFDLKEVKERIVEHLAVLKLNPTAKAPILCFVGPPGVGKTSLGQSIARALGRKFERMSLGGLHDESELRGHRRTYIGAMPGRVIQAIRRAGVANPVLMLDEVDKLGADFRGDPAAALLEILDPAQNHEFYDNYLNMPFDLSKVLFIATANTLESILRPLLDRMEVLRVSGYSTEEKAQIARRYLIPRQTTETGLTPEQLTIPDDVLRRIIRRYTREAGVRQLERTLGRVARKVAINFAEGRDGAVTVRQEDLLDMLGPERFFEEQARKQSNPGVAAGLAWTEAGGDVLYIEAVLLPDGKGLTLTGHLGNVMQESAKAAQSYIWSQAQELGIDREVIGHSGVHIHVPAGAVPKDGPSAGVTMATALASAYSHLPVRTDTAMTGEITLSGLVLPVGGIKEKVLAAHRAGIRRIILPKDNEPDLRELPSEVRDQIEVVLAERIEDVLSAAIPEMAGRLQAATMGGTGVLASA
jgi:ATP-dependent Lon protease